MQEQVNLTYQPSTIKYKLFSILLICLIFFSFPANVIAGTIKERIQQYPQWNNKPPVQTARGDLEYPEWMAGTWKVTSTLVDQVAPLAPDIVSPGFKDNNDYLNQAISFKVRFGTEYHTHISGLSSLFSSAQSIVVADRAFNGHKIAEAYLGQDNVYQVKTDPDNPNQQITFLRGEKKLISKITGRKREIPNEHEFIATEVTQQLFRSPERIYLNEVETTSDYHLLDSGNIAAQQITAIYLSPQDPDYFAANDRPIALYRYNLELIADN